MRLDLLRQGTPPINIATFQRSSLVSVRAPWVPLYIEISNSWENLFRSTPLGHLGWILPEPGLFTFTSLSGSYPGSISMWFMRSSAGLRESTYLPSLHLSFLPFYMDWIDLRHVWIKEFLSLTSPESEGYFFRWLCHYSTRSSSVLLEESLLVMDWFLNLAWFQRFSSYLSRIGFRCSRREMRSYWDLLPLAL